MPQSTKVRPRAADTKVRVCFDFPSVAAALEWFDALRAEGHVPAGSDVFQQDGIDRSGVGVTDGHTYVVRRAGDRPAHHALRAAPKRKKG